MIHQNSSKQNRNPPVHEHHLAKGTLYLMIANVIFLSSGYIVHFGLGRYLGPKEYGTFGVILSLLAITQIFLQNGVSQAVSKYIAEGKDIAQVKNEGMKFQILFSFVIFIIYFSSAPLLADLLNDVGLTNYIRLSAFVLPIRAVTEIYKGTLVGVRAFDKRAKTTAFYAVTKVLVVFVLVAIGLAITGVIIGYIIATFAALILAKHWCAFNKSRLSDKIGDTFVKGTIIKFAFPIILFAFAYTAIMNIDLLFVKAFVIGEAKIGFYTSAWAIASLPFSIFFAVSCTLLPSISRSTSMNEDEQTRSYINHSLRYLLMILLPVTLLISATSKSLLSLAYTPKYSQGGDALSILIFGITFLTVFVTLATIITGSGKPKVSMGIALSLVPICIALNSVLVPRYQLEGAALATTLTAFIGMSVALVYVARRFRALINPISFVRICAASLTVYFIAIWYSVSGIWMIGWYGLLFLVFVALLRVFKEIKKEDIGMIKYTILKPR